MRKTECGRENNREMGPDEGTGERKTSSSPGKRKSHQDEKKERRPVDEVTLVWAADLVKGLMDWFV